MNISELPLFKLAKQIHYLTDGRIAFHDIQSRCLLCYPIMTSPFCWEIIKHDCLKKRCEKCDRDALARALKTKKPQVYKCHMGLTEIVTPISLKGEVIGFLTIGQLLEKENKNEIIKTIKNTCKEQNLSTESLLYSLDSLRPLSTKKIEGAEHYSEIVSEYVVQHEFFLNDTFGIAYEIRRYIADNFEKGLTNTRICERFHISNSNLHKIMTTTFGKTTNQLITDDRIAMAKKLIKYEGTNSINEIAEAVGIYDPNYFCKVFKKITGITPSEYKKSLNKKNK